MRQTIQVDVLTTDEATVAEVQGTTYRETTRGDLLGKGFAKKHPNDDHDPEVGYALAMARALRELAESYETRAWNRINNPWKTPDYAMSGVVLNTDIPTYDKTWLDRVLGKGMSSA